MGTNEPLSNADLDMLLKAMESQSVKPINGYYCFDKDGNPITKKQLAVLQSTHDVKFVFGG